MTMHKTWYCRLATRLAFSTIVMIGVAQPAAAQGASDAREVTLSLMVDESGGCQITVNPETAVISRGAQKKIKKVEWVAAPNAELGELFWELRWDPDKGGSSEDYFGAVNLECGASRIKVQPSPKPKIPNAQWPYAVTVYGCEDGVKGARICTVDPRIQWDD